ncbi:MAG: hypothetical protein ACU0A6_07110 [Shimia sp.]|uniref:hypothetical protein n=1 Tax=Shimia sp. TaxID=1954381 RepID=UPI0040597E84
MRSSMLYEALDARLDRWNAEVVAVDEQNLSAFLASQDTGDGPRLLVVDKELVSGNIGALSEWRAASSGRVVALADFGGSGLDTLTMEEAVDQIVVKPISTDRLAEALKLQRTEAPLADAVPMAERNNAGPKPKVLLVDDNATNRKIVELLLKRQGVLYTTAVDGFEAVEKVTSFAQISS